MAGTEDLARSAVERLSEDESLRGDLSDIGFGPLLDWATAAATAYSQQAGNQEAMDKYTDRLRGVIQEAVSVAENGKLDDPTALMDFEAAPAALDKAKTDLQALKMGDDADENATQIAAILQNALKAAPPASAPAPTAPAQATNSEAHPKHETTKEKEAAKEHKEAQHPHEQA